MRRVAPNLVITSEAFGRAMIAVASPGTEIPGHILRPADINRLGTAPTRHN